MMMYHCGPHNTIFGRKRMATTCCTHSFFRNRSVTIHLETSSQRKNQKKKKENREKNKENKKRVCQSGSCMRQRILRFHKYPGQLTLPTPQKVASPSLIPYLPVDITMIGVILANDGHHRWPRSNIHMDKRARYQSSSRFPEAQQCILGLGGPLNTQRRRRCR